MKQNIKNNDTNEILYALFDVYRQHIKYNDIQAEQFIVFLLKMRYNIFSYNISIL